MEEIQHPLSSMCVKKFKLFFVVVIDEEKKLNATYIISVARKLGCSIFLLPEDIIQVRMLFG